MVSHFAECIRTSKQPLTDGEAGLRVVKILEAAQRSIKAQGGRITIVETAPYTIKAERSQIRIWNEHRRAA
jgi:hypothetical protein